MIDKTKLTRAFAALRREGFVAKQNFSCCGSCAAHALASDHPNRPVVYYHRQDAATAWPRRRRSGFPRGGGDLYLGYGIANGNSDADDAAVGLKVVDALRAEGLEVEWNGDSHTRIKVYEVEAPRVAPVVFDPIALGC